MSHTEKKFSRHFLIILLSQLFSNLADILSSSKVVLPWLMTAAGVPAFFVSLLVPIRESGSLLPQVFLVNYVHQHAIRKRIFSMGSVAQGLAILFMGFVLVHYSGIVAGILTIVLLIVFSLFRSLCSLVSKDVMGKVIAKPLRGQLIGYATSLSGIVTLLVSLLLVSGLSPMGQNIHLLLFIGSFCFVLSGLCYLFIKEGKSEIKTENTVYKQLQNSWSLLKEKPELRYFIFVRSALVSSGLVLPYIVILAQASSGNSQNATIDSMGIGIFLATNSIASIVSGIIWGRLADQNTRKLIARTALMSTVIIAATCLLSAIDAAALSFFFYIGLFFVMAVVHDGVRVARKTYLVNLMSGNHRTEAVSLTNSLVGIVLLLVGALTALLSYFSLTLTLGFFVIMSFLATLMSRKLSDL